MKLVTFTRDMRPYATGQEAYLPDAMADRLVASGEAANPRPFPPPANATPLLEGEGGSAEQSRVRGRRQSYLTK